MFVRFVGEPSNNVLFAALGRDCAVVQRKRKPWAHKKNNTGITRANTQCEYVLISLREEYKILLICSAFRADNNYIVRRIITLVFRREKKHRDDRVENSDGRP